MRSGLAKLAIKCRLYIVVYRNEKEESGNTRMTEEMTCYFKNNPRICKRKKYRFKRLFTGHSEHIPFTSIDVDTSLAKTSI